MLEIFLIGLRHLSLGPRQDLKRLYHRAYKKLPLEEFYIFQLAYASVIKLTKELDKTTRGGV